MLQSGPSGSISQEAEQTLSQGVDGKWQVSEGFALFTAEFSRVGHDLLLQSETGEVLRLPDYFIGDIPAEVIADDGASLAGRVVERLAGPLFPGQYAQAGGFNQADAIGQVETLTGNAFAQRTDGTIVELQIGTKVFQGDVVRTELGGEMSLTFTDGTIFTLASGSRMVLDELIYDPESTDNSGVFDLVEGGFVFIAGQAAGTGGIEINTPAATMGIRGTTVLVDIQTTNGVATVTVSLNPDPDGGQGSIDLFDLSGELITTITTTDTKWIIRPPFTDEPPVEVERFSADLADDAVLLSQAVAAFQSAVTRVANGETFVELSEGDSDAPDIENEIIEDDADEGDGDGDPITPPPLDETGDGSDGTESGTGNPELDGTDEPLPEGEEGTGEEDDASLETEAPVTEVATNSSGAPDIDTTPIQSVEDTPITGRLPVTDRDGDAFEVTLVRGAENGLVVLDTDGVFTYTPDPDFEGTDSFVVTAQDETGEATESEITVVVDAVNDAPIVDLAVAEGGAFETSLNAEDVSGRAIGQVTYSDVDEGDTLGQWSITPSGDNTTALGTITIDPTTGEWAYELDQTAADALAEDQQVVETFLADVTDGEGAVDTTTIAITVTGSNDGPVITSDASIGIAALSEGITGFNTLDTGEGEGDQTEVPPPQASEGEVAGSVSGTFSFFDVDQGDTPGQWSVTPDATNTSDFGSVAIDALTGNWTYTLDERAADVLGNDDTAIERFTATVTDAFGATASQQIVVTVTGFNDAPTIEFSIEDIEATVFEAGFVADEAEGESTGAAIRLAAMDIAEADATGTLRYTDPDGNPGDTATWAVAPDVASYGEMTIDPVTGEWHYFLDEAAADGLSEGEEVFETFIATVTDNLGAASTQTITITVVGANDASEIVATPQDLTGSAADGGNSTASGTLTFVDPDAAPGEVATWSVTPDGPTRGAMTIDPLTGEWLYTLDQTLADSLGQGAEVQEFFTATLTDALGATSDQTITITLTGENDTPVITQADSTGMVVEAGAAGAGTAVASATLTAVDPDADGAIPIWTIVPVTANTTALGAMIIDPVSGVWTYTLDQVAADAMTDGDTAVEQFTATITDPFGASASTVVEVTINGTNDAPVVTNGTGNANEAGNAISIDLSALATDVDAGESGSTLTYALATAPAEGTAAVSGTDLTFDPGNDFADLAAGETRDVDVAFTATDAGGVTVPGTVTITVTGTNSIPTVSAGTASLDEDDTSVVVDLALLSDDPDNGEDGGTLTYTLDGAPALGNADIQGSELTFVPDGAFDELAVGETADVEIAFTATDAAGATAQGTVTITVTGTNSAPTFAPATAELTEDTPDIIVKLSDFGDDPDTGEDGSTLSYALIGAPTAGTAVVSGAELTFTPGTDFDGLATGETTVVVLNLAATDGAGASTDGTVTITVTGANDAPTLQASSLALTENTPQVSLDLSTLGADIDSGEDGSTLSYAISAAPALGTATLSGSQLSFNTANAFDGLGSNETTTVDIGITATDTAGASVSSTVTVTVSGTNDEPIITQATSTTTGAVQEAGDSTAGTATASGSLTYSDADEASPNEGVWSISPASSALGSMAIGSQSGNWTYTLSNAAANALNDGEVRTESFTATVTDADGATDTQTITITITGSNDAPTLSAVTEAIDADGGSVTISLNPLANDADAGDTDATLSYEIVNGPSAGSLTLSGSQLIFAVGSDFDGLADGDTQTVSFVIRVTDAAGSSDQTQMSVIVTGTQTAPMITSGTTEAEGSVTEAGIAGQGQPTTGGTLAYDDPDATTPTSGVWSVSPAESALGAIAINPSSGAWLYTLDNSAADALNEGETRTETFVATITDEDGLTDSQTITVEVTGANDAPMLASATEPLTESTQSASIDLVALASDPDAADTAGNLSFSIVSQPALGTASISNGSLVFTPGTAFETLGEGEVESVLVDVSVSDGNGGSSVTTLQFDITGENDAPVIVVAESTLVGTASEEGVGQAGGPSADATGALTYEDIDEADGAPGQWSVTPSTSSFGTLEINPDTGVWQYFLDDAATDFLREGASVEDSFTATITDAAGATDQQLITLTITGTNDVPVVNETTSETQGDITEGSVLTVSGQLAANDPDDVLAAPTWQIAPNPAGGGDVYGSMSINASTGFWTYSVAEAAIDALQVGDVENETYIATVTDEFGETDTITVQVQITGTNDAPEIIALTSDLSGAVTEPGTTSPGSLVDTGTMDYFDVDEGSTTGQWSVALTNPAQFGNAVINAATGTWTYTLNAAAVDDLGAGQTGTDMFEVVYTDAQGATSAPQEITVDITGANDAAVITGAVIGFVQDGLAPVTTTGDLNHTDVDANNDDDFWQSASGTATYGSYSLTNAGVWTYILDTGNSAVDGLGAGDSLTDTFDVFTEDGTSQTVTITVTGENDPAVITGATTAIVTETGVLVSSTAPATGDLDHTDVDVGDIDGEFIAQSVPLLADNAYGSFTVTTGGLWSYVLDNSDTAVDALQSGETLEDTFTVRSTDGTPQVVTIEIVGTNDAAVVTGTVAAAVVENSILDNTNGNLDSADVDNDDDTWQIVTVASNTASENGYGTYSIDAAGNWTYEVDNADLTVRALNTGDPVLEDTFTVLTQDGTEQEVLIQIAGSNEAAVIAGATSDSVSEDDPNDTIMGTLTATDIDNPDDLFLLQNPIASGFGYGTFSVTTAGEWTYMLDNADPMVDALNVGDSLTDLFTVASADGTQQIVTITINGTNDPGTITGDLSDTLTEDSGITMATGTVIYTDPDDPGSLFQTVSDNTTYGSYSYDQNGDWTYTLDTGNATVNGLAAGASVTDTFTIANLTGASETVSITINGANDAPVVGSFGASVNLGTILDPGTGWTEFEGHYYQYVAGPVNFAGALSGAPLLEPNAYVANVTSEAEQTFVTSLAGGNQAWLGGLDLLQDGVWRWRQGPEAGDEFFSGGVFGNSTNGLYTNWEAGQPDIIATMPRALVNSATGEWTDFLTSSVFGYIAEYSEPQIFTGNVSAGNSDPDGDPLTYSSSAVVPGFTLAANGDWTFDPTSTNAYDSLGATGANMLFIPFAVSDGSLTTNSTLELTVNGTNDDVVITSAASESQGTIDEDATTNIVSGNLDHTDVDTDNTDDIWIPVPGAPSEEGYGTYTMSTLGVWTYVVDNNNAVVDALNSTGPNTVLTDRFNVYAADGTPHQVSITINGVNDAATITGSLNPLITEGTGTASGMISGNISSADVDNDDNVFQSFSGLASDRGFGTVSLTTNGGWSYTLDNTDPLVNSISDGITDTDTFTVRSQDGTEETVVVRIRGTNDAAVITGGFAETVVEDAMLTLAGGSVSHTDPDNPDNQFNQVSAAASNLGYGTYSVTPAGSLFYTIDNLNVTVNALNSGQTLDDTVTVTTTDGTTQEITVTIDGANDAAVVTGDISNSINENINTVNGNLDHTDVDNDDNVFIENLSGTSTYGSFTIDTTGAYVYTLNNLNLTINALDVGDTEFDSFTVQTEDLTSQTINIEIYGQNDAPMAATATEMATLGTVEDPGAGWTLFEGHYYQFVDVPTGETWSDARSAANALGGYLPNVTSAAENAFLIGLSGGSVGFIGGSDATTPDSWIWVDGPEAGQQFWQGGVNGTPIGGQFTNWNSIQPSANAENSLHLFGDGSWNDVIDDPLQVMDYFVERSSLAPLTGTLVGIATDPDGDALTFSQVGSLDGLTINSDGTWSLDQNELAYRQLGDGVTTVFTATYQVSDGTTSANGSLEFTLTGVNDAAIITGTGAGTVIEDSMTSSVSGNLNHTDVDTDNAPDVWTPDLEGSGVYGDFLINAAGEWTYNLDNNSPTVNGLDGGQTLIEEVDVFTEDGTKATVTITIVGTDDPGEITGVLNATVTEDTPPNPVMGVVMHSDVDDGPAGINPGNLSATYGNFTINSAGAWSYTLNNGNGAVQALNTGDSLTDTFNIDSGDFSTQATITVTIEGTNDAANIMGTINGTIIEDQTGSVGAVLTHTDPDDPDNTFVDILPTAATYGTYSMSAAGVWQYVADYSNTDFTDLEDGETLSDSFQISTTDGTTETINIELQGNTDIVANNDSGFIQTINVMVVGTAAAQITATREQLDGTTGTNRFDFNVQTRGLQASTLWNSTTLDGIDVVVLGGVETTPGELEGLASYGFISDFYLNGGNVVTTGGVQQQFQQLANGTATDGFLDNVTPLASQSGGTSTASSITIDPPQASNPIVDNIQPTGPGVGFIDNIGPWFTALSGQTDPGTVALANPGFGASSAHSISIQTAPAVGVGNSVYLGGAYLLNDPNYISPAQSVALRTGPADQLLEQAIAWVAGVQKIEVNENVPFTFLAETLLANDDAGGSATIIDVSPISTEGATVFLSGGNVVYNPVTSRTLNDSLNDGETGTDTFEYTISDGAGSTSTATVNVTVNGVTDTDAIPVITTSLGNGFSAQNSARYDFGTSFFSDPDVPTTGIQYYVTRLSAPDADLPSGFNFDPVFNRFTVDLDTATSYDPNFLLVGYEPDGQYNFVKFGISVDSSGDLRFVTTDFSTGFGNGSDFVLEVAFDDAVTSGPVAGIGEYIDLSVLDVFGPLDRVDVLDMENNQENFIDIFENQEWLSFFDGLPKDGARSVTIEADNFDNFFTDLSGAGWTAVVTDNASTPDVVQYFSNGAESDYGPNGFNFLTLTIDGTEVNPTA